MFLPLQALGGIEIVIIVLIFLILAIPVAAVVGLVILLRRRSDDTTSTDVDRIEELEARVEELETALGADD